MSQLTQQVDDVRLGISDTDRCRLEQLALQRRYLLLQFRYVEPFHVSQARRRQDNYGRKTGTSNLTQGGSSTSTLGGQFIGLSLIHI